MRIRVERHVQFSNCAIKTKQNNQLSGTVCLTSLPPDVDCVNLGKNNFEGSPNFTRLPESMKAMYLYENCFSGTIDLGNLPESMMFLDVRTNALSGTVRVPHGLMAILDGNEELTVERIE